MKIVSKEFITELLEDNIVSQKVNEGCTEITREGATEGVLNMNKLILVNTPSTKVISYLPSFYVKKEAMKVLTIMDPSVRFLAAVAPGYISKYIASIAIKIQQRFQKEDAKPLVVEVFMKEKEALEWLRSK